MQGAEAGRLLWESLVGAERYIRSGIAAQIAESQSLHGEDMIPIILAYDATRRLSPYLDDAVYQASTRALEFLEQDLNSFLDLLRVAVDNRNRGLGSEDEDRDSANRALAQAYTQFRQRLDQISTKLREGVEKSEATATLNFSGPVTGQVFGGGQTVAGGNIGSSVLTLPVGDLIQRVDNSGASAAEKKEAKSRLRAFLEHPLVAAVVGGASGAALG
ncbi:MAG: hypothetical protein AAGN46_01585 [Acidobacteriota bacterium]